MSSVVMQVTPHISLMPSKVCDGRERIARVGNDWRCLHSCGDNSRRPRAGGDQNVDRDLHEFGTQRRHLLISAICKALLDDEVLALHVALFGQASPENIETGTPRTWSTYL